MRAYSAIMLASLIVMVTLGVFLSASPTATPSITADVDIDPDVFNIGRKDVFGGVITAYISNLTDDDMSYDVSSINPSTIELSYEGNFVAEAIRATIENDTLIVKFDATQVASYFWLHIAYHMGTIPPQADFTVTLTVTGQLNNDGESFAGDDTIQIILP